MDIQADPLVYFTMCVGPALLNTTLFERTIVMDIPVGLQMRKQVQDAPLALFECGLELDLTSHFKHQIRILCTHGVWPLLSRDEAHSSLINRIPRGVAKTSRTSCSGFSVKLLFIK
jgi:hypothetical protein